MKKKFLVLFLCFLTFVSCKHKEMQSDYALENPTLQEETKGIELIDEENRKIYLRSLMNVQNTLVEDEKIETDLLNILQGLKEKDEDLKITPTLHKIDDNLFNLNDLSLFSVDGEEMKENIKLSLYKIGI